MRKVIGLSFVMLAVLCGCSKEKETKTTTCKKAGSEESVVFISEDDKIIHQTETVVMTFDDLGISKEMAQDSSVVDDIYQSYKKFFSSITQGYEITYELKIEEEKMIFKHTTDYTLVDMDELRALDFIDQGTSDFISLEATLPMMQSKGFICELEQ